VGAARGARRRFGGWHSLLPLHSCSHAPIPWPHTRQAPPPPSLSPSPPSAYLQDQDQDCEAGDRETLHFLERMRSNLRTEEFKLESISPLRGAFAGFLRTDGVSVRVGTRSPRAQNDESGEALYQRDGACLDRARRRLLECLPPAPYSCVSIASQSSRRRPLSRRLSRQLGLQRPRSSSAWASSSRCRPSRHRPPPPWCRSARTRPAGFRRGRSCACSASAWWRSTLAKPTG
jgi:hypothetical protein